MNLLIGIILALAALFFLGAVFLTGAVVYGWASGLCVAAAFREGELL